MKTKSTENFQLLQLKKNLYITWAFIVIETVNQHLQHGQQDAAKRDATVPK